MEEYTGVRIETIAIVETDIIITSGDAEGKEYDAKE